MSGIVSYMNITPLLSSSREWLEETSAFEQAVHPPVSSHALWVQVSLDVNSVS